MSTFSNLKGYPFFRDIPNWFLPFDTDSQDVARILESSAQDLGEIISLSPMICDSDKYSIVFSLEHIIPSTRQEKTSATNTFRTFIAFSISTGVKASSEILFHPR